jgi:glycosyltransferase involved in cell wall biosynthesis
MRISFYAPLKPPDHPVPSGDREMARLLMRALAAAGHQVELASGLRSFRAAPPGESGGDVPFQAKAEVGRLAAAWEAAGPPDLWLSYHPYYKAPDLLGPQLTARFGVPYVTAEASYAPKRDRDGWAGSQDAVLGAVRRAALNLCFTQRDRDGLQAAAPDARFATLPPFIDVSPFRPSRSPERGRLATVAMMRSGDKLESYRMLADALGRIADLGWTLTVIGDGPARSDVAAAFAPFAPGRIELLGAVAPEAVPAALQGAAIYAWPGCGEAYGLAYLEAQAAGLPAVAQNTAGVPAVVLDGRTGLLTPAGDVGAYAAALARLLRDEMERQALGAAARRFVTIERSLEAAAKRLDLLIREAVAQ